MVILLVCVTVVRAIFHTNRGTVLFSYNKIDSCTHIAISVTISVVHFLNIQYP